MFEKTKNHLSANPLKVESDEEELKILFFSSIKSALEAYDNGRISENREKDIQIIHLIFNNFSSVEECKQKIEHYFSGQSAELLFKNKPLNPQDSELLARLKNHCFKTGFLDGSQLEDYVTAAIDSFYEHILQPLIYERTVNNNLELIKKALLNGLFNAKHQLLLEERDKLELDSSFQHIKDQIHAIQDTETLLFLLNTFSNSALDKNSLEYVFKNNIQAIINKNVRFNEHYSEMTLEYTFKDFLNLHLELYQKEKEVIDFSIYNNDDSIIALLNEAPPPALQEIQNKPMSALLKKHLLRIYDEYNQHSEHYNSKRQVKVKTWELHPKSKKIIIALHGWRDSVECWNSLGQFVIQKGYQVIAYDHRGYGFDEERRTLGHKNDFLNLDFRKFFDAIVKENPDAEIHLVGHSMGSAILLNNQDFIESQPKIKSVTCFSPAVIPSWGAFIGEIRNAIFGREAHEEVISRHQNNQPRFSTEVLKIVSTIVDLVTMMIQAYQSMKLLINKAPTTCWTLFYGEKDKAVPYSSFEKAQQEQPDHKISFKKFPRGDHLLTQGRNSTATLDAFLESINPQPLETDDLELNSNPTSLSI